LAVEGSRERDLKGATTRAFRLTKSNAAADFRITRIRVPNSCIGYRITARPGEFELFVTQIPKETISICRVQICYMVPGKLADEQEGWVDARILVRRKASVYRGP